MRALRQLQVETQCRIHAVPACLDDRASVIESMCGFMVRPASAGDAERAQRVERVAIDVRGDMLFDTVGRRVDERRCDREEARAVGDVGLDKASTSACA